jgi:acyl-CoA reductase-like NAD-dependent aldehyde dehydrogenase
VPDAIHHYIAGLWVPSRAAERLELRNPADDAVLGAAAIASAEEVDRAVAAARAAQGPWADTPVEQRLAVLERFSAAIAARSEALATTITAEMGCPVGFSRTAQIGLALGGIAAAVAGMRELVLEEQVSRSLVRREAVGVIAAITPWNFPLHQIIAKAAPALAAGCTVVLKPSEVTPLDAVLLAEAFEAADAPPGVFNLVIGDRATGAALASHPDVDMVSFTGSTRGGRAVAEIAGKTLKKVALELGGKSANVVLDDADLGSVIPAALGQCFINSGQVCAALSRLLVPRARLAEVEALAREAAAAWVPGDPSDPATRMGPLANRTQQSLVQSAVRGALDAGARLVVGGAETPVGFEGGAYVAATVLSDVAPDMAIAREETFGPVISLLAYDDEDHAVRLANDSAYGLSGGVWSADPRRAVAVARRLRTGQVIINGASLDLAAPFGGVKASGLGRENGRFGVEEFLQFKAIVGVTPA